MSRGGWRKPGTPKPSEDVGPGDPAQGERVPRCRCCGMPERPGAKLYPGMWAYIRFNLEVTLCGKCIEEFLPDRRALDPMTLDEVA